VGWRGDGGDEGAGDGDSGDDDPMKSSAMAMMMATISPIREAISPIDS
jgi:hypothetical protein